MNLLPHQLTGRDFLAANPNAYLADEMRVGKSVQSIAACDVVVDGSILANPDGNVLVICPASLREQWHRQFREFSDKRHAVCVVSYEGAVKAAKRLSAPWQVLIIDEAHYLKNRKSQRTKVVLGEIAPHAKRVWCLSGTPAPNDSSELWPVLRALFPKVVIHDERPMDYWRFVNRFCTTKDNGFGVQITGNKNTGELKERLAPILLRRKAEDVFGKQALPSEMMWLSAEGELAKLQAAVRDELTADIADRLARATPEQADVILARVDDKVKMRLTRLTGLAKAPALCERLSVDLDGGTDKVVVFAWHVDVVDALMDGLSAYRPIVLDGSTPAGMRDRLVRQFQGEKANRVFIGNIKAAGVGLDLTAACEAVFAEMSWVPGDNEQAAARITGLNQKRAARVRYAVLAGSVDERFVSVNARKMKDISLLLG